MCTLQVSEEEVSKLLVTGIDPVKEIHPCYAEFTYTPRSLPDDTTPLVRKSRGKKVVKKKKVRMEEAKVIKLILLFVSAVRPQHV